MPAEVPDQILSAVEPADRLRVEHQTSGGIKDLDPLLAPHHVPVQRVEGHLMRGPIGEIHIDREAVPRVPRGGLAARTGRVLQRSHVGGGRGPGPRALPAECDRRVGRVAGRGVREGVPLLPVGPDPRALRRRIRPHEGGTRGHADGNRYRVGSTVPEIVRHLECQGVTTN